MGSMAISPPPPSPSINWDKLGVGITAVNGHIESRFSISTGKWTRPKLITNPILGVHGLSPALNYGQQAYEGMKAFRDPSGQVRVFRLHDHARRLAYSCSFVSIPAPPTAHFEACVLAAVAANAEFVPPHDSGASLYIRPLIFGLGGQHIGLAPPDEYLFCVYVCPINTYHASPKALNALVLDEFDRAAPRGTGSAKVGGNYAPVMPWTEMARKEGFSLMLHLDSVERLAIDEFSSCGFIAIQATETVGEYRMVIPDSASAIKSVTGDSCVQLAKKLGWQVEKRRILYTELESFEEILAVGTAVSIASVGSITRRATNDRIVYSQDGNPGSCALLLLRKLQEIQLGTAEDGFNWLTQVEERTMDMCI